MSEYPKRPSLSEVMWRVVAQKDEKQLWTEKDTPNNIVENIVEEANELRAVLQENGEDFEMTSGIGSVLYSALKLCYQLKIHPEDAVEMKIVRNDLKHPETAVTVFSVEPT